MRRKAFLGLISVVSESHILFLFGLGIFVMKYWKVSICLIMKLRVIKILILHIYSCHLNKARTKLASTPLQNINVNARNARQNSILDRNVS